MACNHSNPIGYLFCSSCGHALEHQNCVCGFVCAIDALYCGRCGRALSSNEPIASAVEQRYDLELAMRLAGITPKKSVLNSKNEKPALAVKKAETKS